MFRAWLVFALLLALAIEYTPADSSLPWAGLAAKARTVLQQVIDRAQRSAGGGL